MNHSCKNDILTTPISNLPVSADFRQAAEANGFETLNCLLKHHTSALERLPGFSQQAIIDYVGFLEDRSLGHMIDP